MATTSELKYLFSVLYADGSIFKQTPEDKSETREGGSAYTDVRQDEVVRFGIETADYETIRSGDERTALVDLRDGHFEIDGQNVWVGDAHEHLVGDVVLRLIYFRRNQILFNVEMEETGHRTRYYLGWQATVDGKNYQAMIGMD
jgi:hypothetical protein